MPPIQAQTPKKHNMSVLANAKKFAEVQDDNLLADFVKNPQKKNKESGAGKEPKSPQDIESPSAPMQEEEPEEEEPVQEEELEEEEPVQGEEPMQEEELEEEEFPNVTMRDIEVPQKDTALVEIEKEEDLVTPTTRVVQLELQVQNLEQLIAKAQEDKEQIKEELTAKIWKKKKEVRVWKY